jgi:hypothetical protein
MMANARLARGFVAAALALAVAGCSEYLDRRDGILLGVGDAVQTNVVTHVIDPWPAHARNTRAATDGDRLQRAIERYRNPQAGQGGGGSTPPPALPAAASPAALR